MDLLSDNRTISYTFKVWAIENEHDINSKHHSLYLF